MSDATDTITEKTPPIPPYMSDATDTIGRPPPRRRCNKGHWTDWNTRKWSQLRRRLVTVSVNAA